jgi:hypothetical protein
VSSEGTVLSVNVELDYDKNRSFADLKDAAKSELPSLTGRDEIGGSERWITFSLTK